MPELKILIRLRGRGFTGGAKHKIGNTSFPENFMNKVDREKVAERNNPNPLVL